MLLVFMTFVRFAKSKLLVVISIKVCFVCGPFIGFLAKIPKCQQCLRFDCLNKSINACLNYTSVTVLITQPQISI